MDGQARHSAMKTAAKKEWRTSPRGSTGVTENDWFAEVTLLKQDWSKAQGVRLTAIKSN
jgi:hypothetical protein